MAKYKIVPTGAFKKDASRMEKRGYNMKLLEEVIDTLSKGEKLEKKYDDHPLVGNYKGRRECHILPDWLLIYEISKNELILVLTRTGTHSDVF